MEQFGQAADRPPDVTDDVFLGGALHILQPKAGYRAGLDAVLLAAACGVAPGSAAHVLDAGAGVGVVGLSVARRIETTRVTLVEMEPELAELARQNAERNELSERVRVAIANVADGGSAFNAASESLTPATFTHVLANPPYYAAGRGTKPASRLKTAAHQMPWDDVDAWIRFLATAATSDGIATLIHRADALGSLLSALDGRFGAVKVLPAFPRPGASANRVIIQGVKGSRAPLRILPGLILHNDDNSFRPEVNAILRHGAALHMDAL
jgi:tRNA1(Val) A37 N6-methylase TrmN6